MFKALEFPFTKNGWTHECLEREGLLCLIRRHKEGVQEHFEVVLLKQRPKSIYERGGKQIEAPAQETYPRSEDWGAYGFSYTKNSHHDPLASAKKRFGQLLEALGK